MQQLKAGDSAIYTTCLGNKFSVLILEALESGSYLIRRDGVCDDETCIPDFRIYECRTPYLHELKDPQIFTGKGMATLEYRAPEPGDDEKRAIWDFKLKKYEEEIAAKWLSYAKIKKGAVVECYEWNSWTGERFLKCVGEVTFVRWDFSCYVRDTEGNEHSSLLFKVRVIQDAPSETTCY